MSALLKDTVTKHPFKLQYW